jgi:hydroxymethylpyrimidine/phosphomethylpyrimidine kinase
VRGDETSLFVALAACLLGYGEVGKWLVREASKRGADIVLDGNPYKAWVDDYAGPAYQSAVAHGLGTFVAALLRWN